ncbi:hypothetical protein Avbf_04604 [Armadillidium vulgare]|nr:hypothetical protein Avbf_04604 [Armadillidium vulgare]
MLYRRSLLQKSAFYLHHRYVNTLTALSTAFNSRPDSFHKSNLFSKQTGLFGETRLVDASGFYILEEHAVAQTDKLLKECCSPDRKRKMVESSSGWHIQVFLSHQLQKVLASPLFNVTLDFHYLLHNAMECGICIHLEEAKRINFGMDGNNVVVGGMLADNAMEITREAAYKGDERKPCRNTSAGSGVF